MRTYRCRERIGLVLAVVALSLAGAPGQAATDLGPTVITFGDATSPGDASGVRAASPIVGMATTPDGTGSWLAARNGAVFAVGTASTFGSADGLRLTQPVVGMAATPTGRGYWLVASDGGIFNYGDAPFLGSTVQMCAFDWQRNRLISFVALTSLGRPVSRDSTSAGVQPAVSTAAVKPR